MLNSCKSHHNEELLSIIFIFVLIFQIIKAQKIKQNRPERETQNKCILFSHSSNAYKL